VVWREDDAPLPPRRAAHSLRDLPAEAEYCGEGGREIEKTD